VPGHWSRLIIGDNVFVLTFLTTTGTNIKKQSNNNNNPNERMTYQQPKHSASSTSNSWDDCSDPPPVNPVYDVESEIVHADAEPEIVYGVEPPPTNAPDSSTTPSSNTNNQAVVETPHTGRQLGGAAVAGGLVGLVLGGPIIAAVAAGGAVLAVTTKGQAGNVARASGDAMASAGDRLRKVDKKHHVVEKTSKGIVKGCNWVSRRLKPKNASTPPSPPAQAAAA
jgi:hypothetical protein